MKNSIRIVALGVLMFIATITTIDAASVRHESKSVHVAGSTKSMNVVYIDPSDKTIEIRPVLALDQVGKTESLKNIVDRTGAIAAINGTFFNAYSDDKQPHGVIQLNGKLLHSGVSGSVVGFAGDNRLSIANLAPKITGSKNDSWEWPNNWYAWGFNHDSTTHNPDAVVIFTPEHNDKKTSGENAISVVVVNDKVTNITEAHVGIPVDGYVIRIGKQAGDKLTSLFEIGDNVEYKVEYNAVTPSGNSSWEGIRHSIGAGPILVHNGKVDVDFVRDGMPDPKLTTNVAMRSFIGVKSNGIIGIGTVNSVTVLQLATIVKDLGFVEAMNLDGGASSGLAYNNQVITTPGRELSNAIVFIRHESNLPRLNVNGQELFLDVLAYMDFIAGDRNRGVTMIPARGVLEQTGATISWDAVAKKVTAIRGDMIVELVVDSDVAKVNGVNKKLDMPAVIKSNRLFVPIRFISEALGDSVDWNQAEFMVYITSEHANETISIGDVLQQANAAYADGDFALASDLYTSYITNNPNVNETDYSRWGWGSYNARNAGVTYIENAEKAFIAYSKQFPAATGGYYGLAGTYRLFFFQEILGNKERIIANYQKVIDLDPTSERASIAREYINANQ